MPLFFLSDLFLEARAEIKKMILLGFWFKWEHENLHSKLSATFKPPTVKTMVWALLDSFSVVKYKLKHRFKWRVIIIFFILFLWFSRSSLVKVMWLAFTSKFETCHSKIISTTSWPFPEVGPDPIHYQIWGQLQVCFFKKPWKKWNKGIHIQLGSAFLRYLF